MSKDTRTVKTTLLSSLNQDIKELSQEFTTEIIRGYLKKDLNSIYSFVDRDASIKLVFNQKVLNEYLSTLPTYLTYENLENYMITLKKYRYDYLIYQTGNDINYKIVCYIDTFDIDTSSKKLIDPLPDNVNMQKDLREKSNVVFSKAVREMVSNVLNNNYDNNQLSAKNFILHSYKSSESNNKSIFELLKSSISKEGSLFLLKSKVSLDNIGYLFDDNDSKTNFILKSITWKKLYASMPSMKYKKSNEVFESSKYPLNTLIEKVSDPNFEPQFLDMNVEVNEMTIGNFLSKKVKRHTDDEYLKDKQIPNRIKELMNKYGDVLSTISKNDIDKYKKYRIYSEITN